MHPKTAFKKKFGQLATQYDRLKQLCQDQVSDSRWSREWMHCIQPLGAEFGFRTGKWLKSEPAKKLDTHRCDFTADSRPMIETWFQRDPYGTRYRENLYLYSDNATAVATFDTFISDKRETVELVTLEFVHLSDRVPTAYEKLNFLGAGLSGDYLRHDYSIKDGKIVGARALDDCEGEDAVAEWVVEYDLDREVKSIKITSGKDPTRRGRMIYVRKSRLPNLRRLSADIERSLAELVPTKLKLAKINEPAYAVVLAYYGNQNALPPMVAVGSSKQREQWTKQLPAADLVEMLWNPEEYELDYDRTKVHEDSGQSLGNKFAYFSQLVGDKHSTRDVRKLFNRVAKRLARYDWSDTLNTTDDFVVLAVDVECLDEIPGNAKQSISRSLRSQLHKRGWL